MSISPSTIYKADKLSFTRHDFAIMLERLIEDGILDAESNINDAGFDFKFHSASYYLFTEDMITFDREDKCISAKFYNYNKAWWICDDDGEYVNQDPDDTVHTLKFYFIEDIENYIRNVYTEAHIAIEALKNKRLIDEIEKL